VKVHLHDRDFGRRTQSRLEGLVAVVADLLAQDRLAVLRDDDDALRTDLLELLGQEEGATLGALVAADAVVAVMAEGAAAAARGRALGKVAERSNERSLCLDGDGAGTSVIARLFGKDD